MGDLKLEVLQSRTKTSDDVKVTVFITVRESFISYL